MILKGAMSEILTGMRIGIGFGWTTLVAAELVATQQGLGAMIMSASEFLVTSVGLGYLGVSTAKTRGYWIARSSRATTR